MAAVAPDAAEVVGTAFLLDGTPAADTYAKARRTGGVGAGPGRVRVVVAGATHHPSQPGCLACDNSAHGGGVGGGGGGAL